MTACPTCAQPQVALLPGAPTGPCPRCVAAPPPVPPRPAAQCQPLALFPVPDPTGTPDLFA